MRFDTDSGANFIEADAVFVSHTCFRPESDEIANLEAPPAHASGLAIFLDEDDAGRHESTLAGGLFGVTVIFARLEIRQRVSVEHLTLRPGVRESSSARRGPFAVAQVARTTLRVKTSLAWIYTESESPDQRIR
jgi:hypothetical protein